MLSEPPDVADRDIEPLYAHLLRAAVRSAALGDDRALLALSPRLSDAASLERLWVEELFWNHRSPLLIAYEMSRANAGGFLRLPEVFLRRLDLIAEAGKRRNALMMGECAD
ncbi:hypothetical protein HN371_28550, partial [Candidatus Poribacteria bacterium]|nr:hypothetical protein [Candidatus Poribacteria bacterium]